MSELDELLGATRAPFAPVGVTVGVVTNNADPQHLARVKVRFPALSDTVESAWASVLTPMAGPSRGLYAPPHEGDVVLVAFEQGDVNRPFVLGAFWAGPQKPPADAPDDLRVLRSRSGHEIRLDDSEGGERIEIVDKSGKNTITIDTVTNKITVTAAGPVTIAADGDMELTAKGGLTLSGQRVSVSAKQDLALSGGQRAALSSDGPVAVRGAVVDIN